MCRKPYVKNCKSLEAFGPLKVETHLKGEKTTLGKKQKTVSNVWKKSWKRLKRNGKFQREDRTRASKNGGYSAIQYAINELSKATLTLSALLADRNMFEYVQKKPQNHFLICIRGNSETSTLGEKTDNKNSFPLAYVSREYPKNHALH